jgi:tRNA pseudouridine55 synthase
MMHGIFNVLKPPGMTSHDVVSFVRRVAKTKRVGHTGTLDPGAVGVLPVCIGLATRLVDYITEEKKSYRAEITLGIGTDTGDAFGSVISKHTAVSVSRAEIEAILPSFLGNILQIPPMTSAIKIGGKKLYELAHAGIEIERPSRAVTIYDLKVVKWDLELSPPRFLLDIDCSKGTYIRSLCTDMGNALGCGAYMSFLVRTGVGDFTLREATTLEELQEMANQDKLAIKLIPMEQALTHMPKIDVNDQQQTDIFHGRSFFVQASQLAVTEGTIQLSHQNQLLAIAKLETIGNECCIKPVKVFHRDRG